MVVAAIVQLSITSLKDKLSKYIISSLSPPSSVTVKKVSVVVATTSTYSPVTTLVLSSEAQESISPRELLFVLVLA